MWFWTGDLLPVRGWNTHCSLFSCMVCPFSASFTLNSWVQIHPPTGHVHLDLSGTSSMWSTLVSGLCVVLWPNWNGCVRALMIREAGSWEEWGLLTVSQVWWCMPVYLSTWEADAGGTQVTFGYIVRFCFQNTPNKQTNKQTWIGYTCNSTSRKVEAGGSQLRLYSETLSKKQNKTRQNNNNNNKN